VDLLNSNKRQIRTPFTWLISDIVKVTLFNGNIFLI
jgi:hypothetical protein